MPAGFQPIKSSFLFFRFSINDNGEIYVSGDINYEAEQSYIMTVSAVDSGVGPNRQTGEATVLVIVNNIPDIGPRFTSDRYVTFVTEQTTDLVPEVRVLVWILFNFVILCRGSGAVEMTQSSRHMTSK